MDMIYCWSNSSSSFVDISVGVMDGYLMAGLTRAFRSLLAPKCHALHITSIINSRLKHIHCCGQPSSGAPNAS
jgi:hypothetical protein